jgi:hypothetical protein
MGHRLVRGCYLSTQKVYILLISASYTAYTHAATFLFASEDLERALQQHRWPSVKRNASGERCMIDRGMMRVCWMSETSSWPWSLCDCPSLRFLNAVYTLNGMLCAHIQSMELLGGKSGALRPCGRGSAVVHALLLHAICSRSRGR